jgi:TPR repeat protein
VRWLQRAAAHGYIEAQSLLGAIYVQGLAGAASGNTANGALATDLLFANDGPVEPDFATALKWARQAAEADSAKGQALLGYILTYGPEGMRDLADAHRWYERSAAAGCPEGNLGYALSLARRTTDEQGRRKIADQLRRAAAAELPTAIYLLGVITEQGVGVARDPKTSAKLYELAAERGHRSAQLRWGLALMEGTDIDQDLVAGESWLRRAALAGDPEAATLIGNFYVRNGPLPPNYTEAANWYRRAAEAGHQVAARALGSLYLTGAGVPQDDQAAVQWLRVAAEAGDPSSVVDLANLVLGGAGNPDDPAKIARWFAQSAASGDLVSAFNLSICLTKGVGVEQNRDEAALWLRRAAEGVPEAQYVYGRMLADGLDLAPNLEEARLWFTRAAKAELPDAQAALGEMLLNGRGGGARHLFERAAAKGHSGAMFALGALCAGGPGLPADGQRAQEWFHAAAESGHGYAQMMLGRYLMDGTAGDYDPAQGRMWLERAVAQGVAEAESDPARALATDVTDLMPPIFARALQLEGPATRSR